jgi:hypothetical protein
VAGAACAAVAAVAVSDVATKLMSGLATAAPTRIDKIEAFTFRMRVPED